MQRGAHEVAQSAAKVDTLGSVAGRRLSEIFEASEGASTRLRDLGTELEGRVKDVTVASDQAADQLGGAGRTLRRHTHRLRLALVSGRSAKLMRQIGEILKRRTEDLRGTTETTESRLLGVSEEMRKSLEALLSGSDEAVSRVEVVADVLSRQTSGLDSSSAQAVGRMAEVAANMFDRSRDVTASADRAAKLVQLVSEALQRQSTDLRTTSDRAVGDINAVGSAVQENTLELGRVADDSLATLRSARESLEAETTGLATASRDAAGGVESLIGVLAKSARARRRLRWGDGSRQPGRRGGQ